MKLCPFRMLKFSQDIRLMNKKLILIVVLLFLYTQAYCAPSVSTVSDDTPYDGQSITVTGADFGAKATAAPLVFETFEAGADGIGIRGQNCSGYGAWRDIDGWGDFAPVYTDDNQRTGSGLSSYHYLDTTDPVDPQSHADLWITFSETHVETLTISFWYRLTTNTTGSDGSVQFKMWRLTNNESDGWDDNSHSAFLESWWSNRPAGYLGLTQLYHASNTPTTFVAEGDTTLSPNVVDDGTWAQVILQLKQGTAGTATGTIRYWHHDYYYEDIGNLLTYTSFNDWERVLFGYWLGNDDNQMSTAEYQIDDVYIDSSWQTVWIGNASTWAACTAREIQPQSSRTDTSASIVVNQGGLSGDAWLYVMDADGAVSGGHPVTFGSQPTLPGAGKFGAGNSLLIQAGNQIIIGG